MFPVDGSTLYPGTLNDVVKDNALPQLLTDNVNESVPGMPDPKVRLLSFALIVEMHGVAVAVGVRVGVVVAIGVADGAAVGVAVEGAGVGVAVGGTAVATRAPGLPPVGPDGAWVA